jgi:sterol desaturase/sphingolipid hydroxylase (fatty acid hydroxylase superfamily)
MMDWISAVRPALLELTLNGWINVGFIALILLIAAVAAVLGRVPQSE